MKVHVYRTLTDDVAILLEPAPGAGQPPVMLPKVALVDLKTRVAEELAKLEAAKRPQGAG